MASASVSGAILDPDRRSHETKGTANLIFQKALIGKVELYFAVGKDNESRRGNRRLCHVINLDLLS